MVGVATGLVDGRESGSAVGWADVAGLKLTNPEGAYDGISFGSGNEDIDGIVLGDAVEIPDGFKFV